MNDRVMGQAVNPYLPSWEYVPDAEPHIFGDRVYIYGSHDRFNGYAYCLNDYVCWSAPLGDFSSWRYEGVIYTRTDDPRNLDGDACLYAPDVTQGSDGRFYLYYVLDHEPVVSVAVSDTPAGRYHFYGYVKDKNGNLLGERAGDDAQFDPAVLTEGNHTWLYSGFCSAKNPERKGAKAVLLDEDMLTMLSEPSVVVPSWNYGTGTSFENHTFFEASSIRKIGEQYYFIYSSEQKHELCYAVSEYPDQNFVYGGVLVSNADMNIESYKPADMSTAYGGNNHGSLLQVGNQWYVFYHRHTNGMNYCRQGCIEPIEISADGSIRQVEITSSGPNGKPLRGEGTYLAHLACNLFCSVPKLLTEPSGSWMDARFPKITQDGKDGDETEGYIANLRDGAVAGFKYFQCHKLTTVRVRVRGNANGTLEVLTGITANAAVHGKIVLGSSNEWKDYVGDVVIPDGIQALYFRYRGNGYASLKEFELITAEES